MVYSRLTTSAAPTSPDLSVYPLTRSVNNVVLPEHIVRPLRPRRGAVTSTRGGRQRVDGPTLSQRNQSEFGRIPRCR